MAAAVAFGKLQSTEVKDREEARPASTAKGVADRSVLPCGRQYVAAAAAAAAALVKSGVARGCSIAKAVSAASSTSSVAAAHRRSIASSNRESIVLSRLTKSDVAHRRGPRAHAAPPCRLAVLGAVAGTVVAFADAAAAAAAVTVVAVAVLDGREAEEATPAG